MVLKKFTKLFSIIMVVVLSLIIILSFSGCSEEDAEVVYPMAYSCENDEHVKSVDGNLYYVDDDGNYVTGIYALYENNAYYFNKGDQTGLRLDTQYVTEHIISLYFAHGCIFIVKGDERALVIDTGFGFGDVSQLVELFVGDMPYDVALSHTHPDHVGGVCSFEGKADVYTTAEDDALKEVFWSVETRAADVIRDSTSYVVEDLYPVTDTFQFKIFDDGFVFDLGNYEVEVIKTPGHSLGSVAFLLKQDRILFTGDNANKAVLLNFGEYSTTVQTWLASLKSLNERNSEWDNLLTSHNAGNLEQKELLDSLIAIGDKALETYVVNEDPGTTVVLSGSNSCSVQFDTDRVWD